MDTKKYTSDLIATGLTQQELADRLECSQSTIAAYLNGTRGRNLSKAIGDKLERLHRKLCRATPKQVERTPAPPP
jgi:predicted transcriptional regulator